jgi:hypothetical protein
MLRTAYETPTETVLFPASTTHPQVGSDTVENPGPSAAALILEA